MANGTPPPGFEPWCLTLRGEQCWRLEVGGGVEALDTWRSLRDRHARTALWPVILGSDDRVVDQLTWRLEMMSRNAPGIPGPDDVPDASELLVTWLGDVADDDFLADVPRHLTRLVEDAATIRPRLLARPDEDVVTAIEGSPVTVALVPAEAGWEVPALLAWAGAERDHIGGPEHLSVLQLWNEAYGAELVSLGLEQMELLVERPPEDAREAFELAVQHYAYCPALMDHLAPAIGALAATRFGRHWLFDWS